MKLHRLFIIATILFLSFGCASIGDIKPPERIAEADVLYLDSGEEILGRLAGADSKKLIFVDMKGQVNTYPLTQVQRVDMAGSSNDAAQLAELGDPDLKRWIADAPTSETMPNEDQVRLAWISRIRQLDDGRIEHYFRIVTKVLKEAGKRAGSEKIAYMPDITDFELVHARSIGPDGSIADLANTAVKEVAPNLSYADYNRQRKTVFALPKAEPGYVLDVAYTKIWNADTDEAPWMATSKFAVHKPCLYKELVLDIPDSSQIEYHEADMDKGDPWAAMIQGEKRSYGPPPVFDLRKTETRENGRKVTTWIGRTLPVLDSQPKSVSFSSVCPTVYIGRKRDFNSIAQAFWSDAEKKLELSPEAKVFAKEAAEGLTGVEAARALYNKLVYQIRGVGVSQTETSFFVRPAGRIFESGYGNDFDKPFLYYAMLRHLGIEADLIAVRPWHLDNRGKMPVALEMFSDLVVRLKAEGKEIYTSCYSEENAFDELQRDLWGGMAIDLTDGRGDVFYLPKPLPEMFQASFDMDIEVDANGKALVKIDREWTGGIAGRLRGFWKVPKMTLEKIYSKVGRGYFSNGTTVSYDIGDRKNLDLPVREKLVLEADPIQPISAGRYIALSLPGTEYDGAPTIEGERRFDFNLGEPIKIVRSYRIRPLAGCKIVAVPEPVGLSTEFGSLTRDIRKESDGSIVMTDTYISQGRNHSADQWETFSAFGREMQRVGRQRVILELEPGN